MNRRANEEIRSRIVRLIDESGVNLGEKNTKSALAQAEDAGLDLVEVDPNSNPPVCRIMDFGKFLYDEKKKSRKKKTPKTQMKEIWLRPKIDQHDMDTKVKKAREFIKVGHKVRLNLMFKGREVAFKDLGVKVVSQFIGSLADVSVVEQQPRIEGKSVNAIITPARHHDRLVASAV